MAQMEFQGISDAFNVMGEVFTFTHGSYIPTTAIDTTRDWHVVVKLTTSGDNCPIVAGSWKVAIDLQQIGPQDNSESQTIQLRPGPSPIDYEVNFKLSAYSIKPAAYRLVVTVLYYDSAGKPGSISGFNDSLLLELFQSDITSTELTERDSTLRAEKIKVLTVLESSPSVWHTIDSISSATGLSVEKVKKLLRVLDKHIMKESAPNETGSVRYATKARIQRELRSKSQDLDIHTAAKDALSVGENASIDSSQTYERIVGSTTTTFTQLEMNYQQAREQAIGQYRMALISGGVGILLVMFTVVVLVIGQTSTAIATTVSSIAFGTMAAFFFQQSKDSNQRIDKISTKLNETRDVFNLVLLADTVTDLAERDRLKREIITKVLSDQATAG